jgi:hypothetical protein
MARPAGLAVARAELEDSRQNALRWRSPPSEIASRARTTALRTLVTLAASRLEAAEARDARATT